MSRAPLPESPLRWLTLLGALALAAVLLVAGFVKAADPAQFFNDLQTYRAFPHALAVALTYFVPALEITLGLALLHPRWRRAGALLALGLFAAFFALLLVSWARGLNIACGCFGGATAPANYYWLVGRDIFLLALAAAVFFKSREPQRLAP